MIHPFLGPDCPASEAFLRIVAILCMGEYISPAEHGFTKVWSHAKMCVVEVPFKLYCTINVCSMFTASKQIK